MLPSQAWVEDGFELKPTRRARCKQGEILARGKGDGGQGEVVVPLLNKFSNSREVLAVEDRGHDEYR